MKRIRLGAVLATALGSVLSVSANSPVALGASSAVGTSKTLSAPLCRDVPRVVRLSVTRIVVGPSGGQFAFDFPSRVSVDRASAAQEVARVACSLPVAPSGVRSCPAAFDVSYRLSFTVKENKGTVRDILGLEPTGCQVVNGLGAVRSVSERFYRILGSAMGLKNATSQRFAGTFRSSG